MKKQIMVLLSLLLLTGCGSEDAEEQGFHLTAQEQQSYTTAIDAVMEEFYWEYDRASLTFASAIVPEDTAEAERLFAASSACGYALQKKAGQEAVLAEAVLLHYNGDMAGTLQCWFTGGSLSGVAYNGGFDKAAYSLTERNPFLADGNFTAYESWAGVAEGFATGYGELSPEGIYSAGRDGEGKPLFATLEGGDAIIYRYTDGLWAYRRFSYGTGLEATSVTFLEGADARLAVLVSSIEESDGLDAEKTYSRAERVMLYDERLQLAGEIPLEGILCTALGAEKEQLYLFADQDCDIYQKKEDSWERTGSRRLKHGVTAFHGTDLDGDGTGEYLMSDGRDLYLYRNTGGSFRMLWSTHLGVDNFYGPICSGDLNGDGVKEIYACDTTGTTIRYILTEKGLQTANEDIDYGQCIYPGDFDDNGKTDYWMVQDNIERKGQLFLSLGEE
ncbi:MAG: VCBS repeat-containing protein [Bacillota bacterium]|nr:VCBS repeat-containing protein [Bacillota bacterium]